MNDAPALRPCALCADGLAYLPANVCPVCAADLFKLVERSPIVLVPLDASPPETEKPPSLAD